MGLLFSYINFITKIILLFLIFTNNKLIIDKLFSYSKVILPNYQEDTNTLPDILKRGKLLEQINAWSGKLLIVKVNEADTPPKLQKFYYKSLFVDKNANGWQDEKDEGFFNPASTVKVGIAALVLEKMYQLGLGKETKYQMMGESNWYYIDEDIQSSLVISDNDATNRLILFLGFDEINNQMKGKGLQHFVVNRLMLNRGTLIKSPGFRLNFNDVITEHQAQQPVDGFLCYENNKKLGNCATADDLVGVLIRIIQPEYFSSKEGFDLNESDRFWLQKIMSQTPRQVGFDYADNYCRFLSEVESNVASNSGRMLSKCGVVLLQLK